MPQLHRRSAGCALFVVLTVGLFEPLLCILHCHVWLPNMLHEHAAAQPHQHQHQPALAADPDPTGKAHLLCPMTSAASTGHPFYMPPSPVHDALLLAALLLVQLVRLGVRPSAPALHPPRISFPPPVRPPIISL
ncbi:MAG TPA: hypothetical protein PKA05_16585 [Roseiflexaceae bacterium]|nr:hypothetical protein [Roseiflexaceae bacterium]HMP41998.1 hypothetical protein [Roseiflexaceae bacterium]